MNWNGGARARLLDKNNRAYFLRGNRPQNPSLNPRFGHDQEPPSASPIPPCPLLLNTQNLPRGGAIFALQLSLQLGIGQSQRLSASTPGNATRPGNRENGLSPNNATLHRSDSESRASDSVSNNESFVSQSNLDRNVNISDNVKSSPPSPNISDVAPEDTKIPGYSVVSLLSRSSSSEHARPNSIRSNNCRGRGHIRMGTPNPSDSETSSSQGQRHSFSRVANNTVSLSFTSAHDNDSVAGGPNYCNTVSEGIASNVRPNSRTRLSSAVVSSKDIADNSNNSSQNRTRHQSQSQSGHRDVNGNRTVAPNLVNSNKRLPLVDASYGKDDTDYSRTSSDNFPQFGITTLTTLRGRAPPPGQNVFRIPSSIQPQSRQNRSSSSISNPTSTNPVIRRPMSVPSTTEEGHTPNCGRPASTSTPTSASRPTIMVGPNAGSHEVFRHQRRSPANITPSLPSSQASDSNNSSHSDKERPGNQYNSNRGGHTLSLPTSTPGRTISQQSTTSSSSSYHTPVGHGNAHKPDQDSPGIAAPRYFCPTIISSELRSPQDFHGASSSTRSETHGICPDARAPSNFPWTSTNSKDLMFENYPENPGHPIRIGNSTSSGLTRSAANSTTVSGATVTVNTDLALRSLPSASSSTETFEVATMQAQNDPNLSYTSTTTNSDNEIRNNHLRPLLLDVNSSLLPNPHNKAAFLNEPLSLLAAEVEDSRKRFGNNIWEGLKLDSDFDFHPLSLAEYAPRANKVPKMSQNDILIGSDYNFENVDVNMINFDFGESEDDVDDQL